MKIKKAYLNKLKVILLGTLAGLIFLGFFIKELNNIDPHFYKNRDDGIITMSHAKNLVDYGVIGVSPSGERVEGYSAPLHFFSYAISYKLTDVDYISFNDAKLYISTFLLGVVIFMFLRLFNKNILLNILLVGATAILMTRSETFLMWHASGMENDLTHLFFFLSFYLMTRSYVKKKIYFFSIPIIFLASISRSESIFYMLPLVTIYCIGYYLNHKDLNIAKFFSFFLLSWFSYFMLHNLYFQNLFPNTAYAQEISLSDNLQNLFDRNADYSWNSDILDKNVSNNLFIYYLLALPIIALLRFTRKTRFAIVFLSFPIIFAFLHAYLFANTRLDMTRSTTFLTIFSSVFLITILSLSKINIYIKLIITLFFFTPIISILFPLEPYWLCCGAFEETRSSFLEIQEENSIFRPLVANPDLGEVSYYKDFNVLDLGYLGSPFLSHNKDNPRAISEYFFRIAQPDLIESHGMWTCIHKNIFADARFYELYEEYDAWDEYECPNFSNARSGYFVRKDIIENSESRERVLVDKLSNEVKLSTISNSIYECNSIEDTEDSCMYVIRSIYRFLPEIRKEEKQDELIKLVDNIEDENQRIFAKEVLKSYENPSFYISIAKYLNSK